MARRFTAQIAKAAIPKTQQEDIFQTRSNTPDFDMGQIRCE